MDGMCLLCNAYFYIGTYKVLQLLNNFLKFILTQIYNSFMKKKVIIAYYAAYNQICFTF